MEANKSENISLDELVEGLLSAIKNKKNGTEVSTFELMKEYFQTGGLYRFHPRIVHEMIFLKSRENYVLLDNSKNYGIHEGHSYDDKYVVLNKPKYMSSDDFRDMCDEYDSLFVGLDEECIDFEKKKKLILTNWNKEKKSFKKDPLKPRKPRKMLRVKDLDTTEYAEPIAENIAPAGICIIPIGSGSDGNCMYIEFGNYKIIVDAGIPLIKVRAALEKNERKVEDVDALFVTHGHTDHISSIKPLSKAIKGKVYTSEWTKSDLEKIGVECVVINPGSRIEILRDFYITMFRANHDYYMTYGFVFENDDIKISYLTDNGGTNEKQIKYMIGSNVAILEANYDLDMLQRGNNTDTELTWRVTFNHASNIKCGYNMIALHEHGTRNFILAHVSKANNKKELAEKTVKMMLRERWADIHVCDAESDKLLKY